MIIDSFYIKKELIEAVRVNKTYRDKDNNFTLSIVVWVKETEEPYEFVSKILPPEYKEKEIKGLFCTKKVKTLKKISFSKAIKKAFSLEKNYNIHEYYRRLKVFYDNGFVGEEEKKPFMELAEKYPKKRFLTHKINLILSYF